MISVDVVAFFQRIEIRLQQKVPIFGWAQIASDGVNKLISNIRQSANISYPKDAQVQDCDCEKISSFEKETIEVGNKLILYEDILQKYFAFMAFYFTPKSLCEWASRRVAFMRV